jgi:hypothetical protein
VLVGADKWDESLGVTLTPSADVGTPVVTGNDSAEVGPSDGAPMSKFMSR